jgi:phosphomannomutase/phosphoglucomutase
MDTNLDYNFPKYNPNPEDHEMLVSMGKAVLEHGADLCVGFDGDGDRCGVVDDKGEEIFADKIGLLLARDLSKLHKNATFVVDVKSTGLYKTDPVLKENGVTVDYFKTGHSYIKRRTTELDALAGFEKSGHMFFRKPYGYGYDDALVAAAAVLQMLDRNPGRSLSDLKPTLAMRGPRSPCRRTATTRRSTPSSIRSSPITRRSPNWAAKSSAARSST